MAKNALKVFGSLRKVLQASQKELEKIQGIVPNNIFGLKLAQSVARRYLEDRIIMKNVIRSSADVTDYLHHMLGARNLEIFLVLYLNGNNQVLKTEELFKGTLNESAAYPREVVKKVIENNAAALILVHNHPSGNCEPSDQDKILTDRLVSALRTIDVIIHDHIIIAGNDHYSFADHGLL
jgi:DNA repair protein RadC